MLLSRMEIDLQIKLTLILTILQVFRAPHLKLFSFTPVEGTETA
jgi:hypothetical protein